MKRGSLFFFLIFLNGCFGQANTFMEFYETENAIPFKKKLSEQDVLVIETDNYENTVKSFKDKGYVIIGTTLFKDKWIPRYLAVETAMEYGATVVITTSKFVENGVETYRSSFVQPTVGFYSANIGGQTMTGTSVGMTTGTSLGINSYSIFEQKAAFLTQKDEK